VTTGTVLDLISIPVLFPLCILLSLGSIEFGYWLGKRRKLRGGELEGPVVASVGATLGLLAFVLAITFGMAVSRFEDRRQFVVEDANAIGTTYLRTSFLPEPTASELRALLREYVDVRVDVGLHPERLASAVPRSEQLQRLVWRKAAPAVLQQPTDVTALFVESLNHTIDVHGARTAAMRNRIPAPVWYFLLLTAVIGMMSLGYQAGVSGSRRSVAIVCLAAAFSAVIVLIADLDRPQEGFLRVSQQPMVDLQRSMQTDTRAEPAPGASP